MTSKIKKFIDNTKSDALWEIYTENKITQKISSSNTARKQLPQTMKFISIFEMGNSKKILLDIGCGSSNEIFRENITKEGIDYNGCDPFNQTIDVNLTSIEKCKNGQTDLVTLNNVLNTIKETSVWNSLLKQAHNALKDDGILMVLTYEGMKLSAEIKKEKETGVKINKTPTKTRDGWQNRIPTENYLDEVKKVFPNSMITTASGKKIIISTKNNNIDLKIYAKNKNNKNPRVVI
jgi:hypothetical protein